MVTDTKIRNLNTRSIVTLGLEYYKAILKPHLISETAMAQIKSIIETLKSTLKAHGKTYADIASALDLSEASVKRIFAENSFTLERLEQVCALLDLEISDLIQQMNEKQPLLQQLSQAQEQEIADDLQLLLVTICALNRWSLEDICGYYSIEETDCIQKLARLDKLKIIELLPRNKIKLLIAPNFGWLENGPIQTFFQQKIGREYFQQRFDAKGERLIVLNGMLSEQANAEFQRKLMRLVREFDELNNDDAALSLDERSGFTLVMGLRSWRYGLFSPMVRRKAN